MTSWAYLKGKTMKDWYEKPPSKVRSVADTLKDAERQRNELPHVVQVYARDWDKVILADEVVRLRGAIQQTLDENGHLADGENCTLIVLKRALTPNIKVQPPAAFGGSAGTES